MITINSTSKEFTEVEQYLMTISPAMKSIKDVKDGTSIKVSGYLEFTDEKDNGETSEILSVITPDKEVYSCQSATFKRSLKDIATIMGDKPFSVIKTSGKTKAGRDFVNCELDIKSLK